MDVNEYLGVVSDLSVDLKIAKAAGRFITDDDPVIVYKPKTVDAPAVVADAPAVDVAPIEVAADDPVQEEPAVEEVSVTDSLTSVEKGSELLSWPCFD